MIKKKQTYGFIADNKYPSLRIMPAAEWNLSTAIVVDSHKKDAVYLRVCVGENMTNVLTGILVQRASGELHWF